MYGAGSVGAFLGARLIEAGHDVRFIARGANLDTLQSDGLRVQSETFGDRHYRVQAVSSAAEVGAVDYVILGVKANALATIAPLVEPLKGERTAFVSTQNGLPWWYFHGSDGDEQPIRAVDPDGLIEQHIPGSLAIGSIVYLSCTLNGPGQVEHTAGTRLPLGEPSGGRTERILALSQALRAGGIKAPVRGDIRHELWVKLLGNAAFNPVSALTGMTMVEMVSSPASRALIEAMMDETRAVASATGIQIAISNESRIEGGGAAGYHKTSMLQDLERGRDPELEALLGAVIELADRFHVEAATLRAVNSATRALFERRLGHAS